MSVVTHVVVVIVLPLESIEKHFSFTSGAGKRLLSAGHSRFSPLFAAPQIKHYTILYDTFSFFLFGPSTCLEGAVSEGRANTGLAVHSAKGNETWQRFHCPL